MPELPLPGEHHRDPVLVGGRDDLRVAHRAARLHDRRHAGLAPPGPRRRGTGRTRRSPAPRRPCRGPAVRALCTARNAASTRDIWPAPMPIVAPSRASTIAFDFTRRHRAPGEQQVAPLLGRRLRAWSRPATSRRRSTLGARSCTSTPPRTRLKSSAFGVHRARALEHAQVLLAAEDLERLRR